MPRFKCFKCKKRKNHRIIRKRFLKCNGCGHTFIRFKTSQIAKNI